jgi:hypothetical protein
MGGVLLLVIGLSAVGLELNVFGGLFKANTSVYAVNRVFSPTKCRTEPGIPLFYRYRLFSVVFLTICY